MAMIKSLGMAVVALLVAQTAHAEGIHISYADIDISQPSGAAKFHARVEAAAKTFCATHISSSLDFSGLRACNTGVWEEVRNQLTSNQLEQYDVAINGKPEIVVAKR